MLSRFRTATHLTRATFTAGLILIALLCTGAAFAGSSPVLPPVVAAGVNERIPVYTMTAPVGELSAAMPNSTVLRDQFDRPSTQLVNSQNFEASLDRFDAQAADDFIVPDGQSWIIDHIEVAGAYRNSAWADSVNVFFYDNSGILPSTPIFTATNVIPDSGLETGNFVISISPALRLNPGVYWLSVQANEDLVQSNQWYWRDRTGGEYFHQAAWRNPGGGYPRGGGCTIWNRRAGGCTISLNDPDQTFRIYGTPGPVLPTPTGTPPTATPSNTPGIPTPTRTGTQQVPPNPIVTLLVPLDTNTPVPPSPTPAACGVMSNYTVQEAAGATIVPGTSLVPGSQCDYCTVIVSLPFSYTFYDGVFGTAILGSNGALGFTGNNNWDIPTCFPYYYLENSIVASWADLNMAPFLGPNLGIYTSISGSEPTASSI